MPAGSRFALFTSRVAAFVEPRVTGLPNWRVVSWFPILLVIGAAALIILRISGTSSGAHWAYFGAGADPNLLVGYPRGIRSDEWLVHQSWVISQIQQGFPVVNQTLPGGMDVSIALETPVWDWSAIFRPHIWGYFLFGADSGLAWEWWIPALALVTGTYLLIVTYVPRRPFMAAVIACAVFFTPIFQWWYGTSSIYPAAWAMLAIAAVSWLLRDDRLWVRIVWSAAIGWLAVTTVLGLYAPFIIPAVLVFVLYAIGAVLNERSSTGFRVAALLRRLVPILIAGVAAVIAIAVWLVSHGTTLAAVTSTVYPGQRVRVTGALWESDPFLTSFAGAVWGQTFRMADGPTALGDNPSESATVILLAVFLVPTLIYLLVTGYRAAKRVDWVIASVLATNVILLAYLLVPGWDLIAHLLLLDRVPPERAWMGFVVLLPLTVALIVRDVDARRTQLPLWLPLGTVLGVAAIHGYLLWRIVAESPEVLTISPLWPAALVAVLAATFFVLRRDRSIIAAIALLAASLVIGGNVNPIYVGAFDLRETATGEAIMQMEDAEPGTWLGIGSQEVMALLMETGVEAYNGVQIYPPEELWDEVDPDGEYEQEWNRLAHIQWQFGSGEPVVTSPQADVVRTVFDACSDFAQENVNYVITDQSAPESACLVPVRTVTEANISFQLLEVVPERRV